MFSPLNVAQHFVIGSCLMVNMLMGRARVHCCQSAKYEFGDEYAKH